MGGRRAASAEEERAAERVAGPSRAGFGSRRRTPGSGRGAPISSSSGSDLNGREEGRFGGGGTRGRTGGRPLPGGLLVAPADTGERSWGADLVFVRFGRRGR